MLNERAGVMEKLKQRLTRYKRYSVYFLRWLFVEKPKGLDFSMRNKTRKINREGSHGYALSPKSAVEDMLNTIEISENDNFLDIGSGKGGVLYFACEKPFGRIAGIEVEPFLHDIAVKNFEKLGLSDRVELFLCDAVKFQHYGEFNVFYLFNPFDIDIYKIVLYQIFKCLKIGDMKGKTVWLLCYGGTTSETIRDSGLFDAVSDYRDSYRGSMVHVWKAKPGIGQ